MRQRAFSLVELLVVVSIIAIIMAIALPALGRARRSAADTISQTNLKSLGQWHNVWITEHKNMFYNPLVGVSPPNMASQIGYAFRWIDGVSRYRYDTEGFAVYWYSFLNQTEEGLKLPIESFISPLDAVHREYIHAQRSEGALIPGSYFYSAAFWKSGFGYCSEGNEYGVPYRNVRCHTDKWPPQPELSFHGGVALWSADQMAFPSDKVLLYERADFMQTRRPGGTDASGNPVDTSRPPAWNNPRARPSVIAADSSVQRANVQSLTELAARRGATDATSWLPADALYASDSFPILNRLGNGVIQPQGATDGLFPLFFGTTVEGVRSRDLPR